MTNEMRLLRAFIEASGFEVEEEFILHIACKCRPNSAVMGGDRDCDICCGTGHNGTDFDYKVTKKKIQMGGRESSKTPLILRKHND